MILLARFFNPPQADALSPKLLQQSTEPLITGFSASSFFNDLAAGDCTSCRVTQDKSAYWHPQLYFKDDTTGEYEEVEPLGGMLA